MNVNNVVGLAVGGIGVEVSVGISVGKTTLCAGSLVGVRVSVGRDVGVVVGGIGV